MKDTEGKRQMRLADNYEARRQSELLRTTAAEEARYFAWLLVCFGIVVGIIAGVAYFLIK